MTKTATLTEALADLLWDTPNVDPYLLAEWCVATGAVTEDTPVDDMADIARENIDEWRVSL